MFRFQKKVITIDAPKILDLIENEVYALVKPYGFKKHGRTLHRFVSGDISQVIHFQSGQAYREETHMFWVNVGIRVPECERRSFEPEEKLKKYYHEYECNLRSRLGTVEHKAESYYDLRDNSDVIIADIQRQIQNIVMPAFETLSSRDAILKNRTNYPHVDTMSNHLILLEEAMIYGHEGDIEKATEKFNQHYQQHIKKNKPSNKIEPHKKYLEELAAKLGIEIKPI